MKIQPRISIYEKIPREVGCDCLFLHSCLALAFRQQTSRATLAEEALRKTPLRTTGISFKRARPHAPIDLAPALLDC